jgi:hypothetical protein
LNFCGVQEWEDLVASGAAALAALQQAFADLQPNSSQTDIPGILQRLSDLVSTSLQACRSQLLRPTTSSSAAAGKPYDS